MFKFQLTKKELNILTGFLFAMPWMALIPITPALKHYLENYTVDALGIYELLRSVVVSSLFALPIFLGSLYINRISKWAFVLVLTIATINLLDNAYAATTILTKQALPLFFGFYKLFFMTLWSIVIYSIYTIRNKTADQTERNEC